MEQHPIPQQISSYQFRLVGDMTLKQFFELAGGIIVGLIFYSLPIIGIIKWPFIFVSVLLGIGLAFFPLEERPLEQWIFAFFRSIYSPTLYYWRKNLQQEVFFQNESSPSASREPRSTPKETATAAAAPQKFPVLEKLNKTEAGFLTRLMGLFSTGTPGGTGKVITQQVQGQPQSQAPQPKQQGIKIPKAQPVKIGKNVSPELVVEEQKPKGPQLQYTKVTPTIAGSEYISAKAAQFSPEAAPPNPPTSPNVVVGQVLDEQGKIVENAIMEINDAVGRPVRALKSNRLGHFIIVTPLENGKYEIVTEKEGYQFNNASFEANGSIIPPILIKGKAVQN